VNFASVHILVEVACVVVASVRGSHAMQELYNVLDEKWAFNQEMAFQLEECLPGKAAGQLAVAALQQANYDSKRKADVRRLGYETPHFGSRGSVIAENSDGSAVAGSAGHGSGVRYDHPPLALSARHT
jgi:hypothetical protein